MHWSIVSAGAGGYASLAQLVAATKKNPSRCALGGSRKLPQVGLLVEDFGARRPAFTGRTAAHCMGGDVAPNFYPMAIGV
jgi:hypothetical protein